MRNSLVVLVFVLTALFVPSLPAGATVPRFALLSVALPMLLLWYDVKMPAAVAATLAYLTLLAFIAPDRYNAFDSYWVFVLLAAGFSIGYARVDLKSVFIAAACAMAINSLVVLGQELNLVSVPQVTVRAGLFMNRNSAVEAAAMIAAGVIYYRVWWVLPGLLPTLLAGARAPLIALGAVAVIALWRRAPYVAGLCALVAAAAVLAFWAVAGFTLLSIQDRLSMWYDTAVAFTFLGHGLGSFAYQSPLLQVHTDALLQRFDHPHSDIIQLIYEFGVVGGAFAGLLVYRLSRVERDAAWYALAVFIIEGCVAFPLYLPVTGFLAALCAGHISSPRAPLRRDLDAGRLGIPGRYYTTAG